MQTTGIFTIHRFEISFEKYGEPNYLIPFGDIHRYSRMCHEEKWLEFLDWARTKERAYFLGMGDYDDLASTTEREILSNPKLHEDTKETIDSIFRSRIDSFAKEISFMGDRLIGLLEGNHFGMLPSGITTTQLLAEKLKTRYLGANCFLKLSFISEKRGKRRGNCVDIWAHHGLGASRLTGGSMNTVERMMGAAVASIYLMGHDHQKSIGLKSILELSEGSGKIRLRQKKILLGRTGSFLRAYVDGKASYVVDKAMNPSDLGVIKIELTPRRNQVEGADLVSVDIHASI